MQSSRYDFASLLKSTSPPFEPELSDFAPLLRARGRVCKLCRWHSNIVRNLNAFQHCARPHCAEATYVQRCDDQPAPDPACCFDCPVDPAPAEQ